MEALFNSHLKKMGIFSPDSGSRYSATRRNDRIAIGENAMIDKNTSKTSLPHRHNFLTSGMIAVSVATAGTMLNRVSRTEYGRTLDYNTGDLTKSDIAILKFLAAVELIECDLWKQYEELGGTSNVSQNTYQLALQRLDSHSSQYISSNAQNEISHAAYINAYLESEGVDPVDFDSFRTLRGSTAKGARNIGRLSNLMHLDMDTRWYSRYHSIEHLDSGDPFPQKIRIVNRQAIPRADADFDRPHHIQAIAKTAVFHFGYIEHAGASLYASLSQKVKRAHVLKVTLGIGGDEIAHFLTWVDFTRVAIQGHPFSFGCGQSPATEYCRSIRDSNLRRGPSISNHDPNFPAPTDFMSKVYRQWPVVLPRDDQFGGAVSSINSFTQNGLFVGQSPEFLRRLTEMAEDADAALHN
jgi:hypothetical protein